MLNAATDKVAVMWSRELSSVAADVREAIRQLTRSRRLSALIIGIIAIGLAGDLAAAAALRAVLSVPLPFPDSEQLLVISMHRPAGEPTDGRISYPIFRDVGRAVPGLREAALFLRSDATLTGLG